MKKIAIAVFLMTGIMAQQAPGAWEPKEFDHYEIILERQPFGEPAEPPPSSENEGEEKKTTPSPARNLRLSALWEVEGDGIRAGIMDLENNENYTLAVGQTVEGIELVSADYDDEEVVLRVDSEKARLELQSGSNTSASQKKENDSRSARLNRSKSYLERRKARREAQQRARKRPEPKKPKFEGEELKQRLQEVQMDAIRTGKPPLPIPLTEEMDEQLVEEGVLPPMGQ